MGSLFPWAIDELLPELQIREIMQPTFGVFASAQAYGWDDWVGKIPAEVLARITPMQRGGTVYDIMVSHAVELFAANAIPGITVNTDLGFAQFYIDNKVVVRFKKLRRNGMVSWGSLKPQGRLWYANKAMAGVRSCCARVTVGYVLDDLEQSIQDILVTCQHKDIVLWKFSILEDAKTVSIPDSNQEAVRPRTEIRARRNETA